MARNRALTLLAGLGIGTGLMYFADPDRGRRRRALLRDQAVRAWHATADAADETLRDLEHRGRGAVLEFLASITREAVSDEVLAERVRARIGRAVSHPSAIEVAARNGTVTLSGPVLEREVENLIPQVYSVRGVLHVENRLELHKDVANVPGLQGSGSRRPRSELLQENWAPATRAVAGSAGAGLIVIGRKVPVIGIPLIAAGAGLLLRSIANQPVRRALGIADSHRGIELEKTMEVHAPVERVYDLCSNPENFPRFMSHVREVRKTDSAYHWTVGGPAGVSVSWDAVVTESIPNRIIAWKSVPGALLRNAGIVRFDPTPEGGTRIHLRMSYNPAGGVIAHAFAALLGSDPKHVLDDDFLRLKSLLEQGKTRAHGETVTREELSA